ncbi:MAG: hypothetical protein RLY97_2257 [Pseudomonadota bacterium]|jgi:glyoxylase-like metal-dependent hydrolase (beta-lactamase superfamily II)
MTRRFNRWLIFFAVLLLLPYWWFMLDNRQGDAAAKPLHIWELRALATSLSGGPPQAVEAENLANRTVTKGLYVTGAGLKRQALAIIAYRLALPDSGPILIDTGPKTDNSQKLHYHHFDAASEQRLVAAMGQASLILLTHRHIDPIGGLKTALSQANHQNLPSHVGAGASKMAAASPYAIAPGVVAIPAPSHAPDTQMYYVWLGDGREYLFTGDIAPYAANFQDIRGKARILDQLDDTKNRREVFSWLITIHQLQIESPKLIIVPSHDYEWLRMAYHHGIIREHFTPEPPHVDKTG